VSGVARLLLPALFALAPLAGAAQDLPALYRVTGVAAGDALNLRATPSARAEILGGLPPWATDVEVVRLSPDGRWGQTNLGEGAGWVAMRFLAPQGGPGWQSGQRGLDCAGTEPFWSLRAFLPSHRAEYVTPENGGVELVVEAGALPSTRFPPTLALPFSGSHQGIAVIRPADCTDGMSDRAFGLEALVYFQGDSQGLSGCCSLLP
jgi:uncharacterized membrane protein